MEVSVRRTAVGGIERAAGQLVWERRSCCAGSICGGELAAVGEERGEEADGDRGDASQYVAETGHWLDLMTPVRGDQAEHR